MRLADRLLLIADRAAVDPTRDLVAGRPHLLPDRPKLLRTPAGVAVAMAGLAAGGADVPDLLATVQTAVAAASDVDEAAIRVRRLFAEAAASVRATPAAAGGAAVMEPFERPVLTVALVAGAAAEGLLLYAVGLTATGPCELSTINVPAVAYGPSQERAALAVTATSAAELPPAEATECLRRMISDVALRQLGWVSVDSDLVSVGPAGAGSIEEFRPRVSVPRGV